MNLDPPTPRKQSILEDRRDEQGALETVLSTSLLNFPLLGTSSSWSPGASKKKMFMKSRLNSKWQGKPEPYSGLQQLGWVFWICFVFRLCPWQAKVPKLGTEHTTAVTQTTEVTTPDLEPRGHQRTPEF